MVVTVAALLTQAKFRPKISSYREMCYHSSTIILRNTILGKRLYAVTTFRSNLPVLLVSKVLQRVSAMDALEKLH